MSDGTASARTIGIIAKPVSVKLAQTLGLTAAAFFAGQTASATYTLLPAIMQSPAQLLARQFHAATSLESIARRMQLPGTVFLGIFFAWLAVREPTFTTRSFRAYAVAAALCPASLAYVAVLVKPTSDAIVSHVQSLQQQPQSRQQMSESQESASTILVGSNPTTTSSSAGSLFDGESPTTVSPAASVRDATSSASIRPDRLTFREFLAQRRVSVQELNTHQLVDRWGWLNLGQAGMLAGAAVAAAWAVASEDLSFFELF